MAEALTESHLGSDLEALAIPPMDPMFLSTDLGFSLDDNEDLHISFDDFDDFDMCFPSDAEQFLVPDSSATPDCDPEMFINSSSPELGSCSGANWPGNSQSPLSSMGSGNCASAASDAANAPSPDSSNIVDQKIETEEISKRRAPKRKKDSEETNSSKFGRSPFSPTLTTCNVNSNNNNTNLSALSDDDEKRRARLMRNRESAQLSRQRKKHYVEELEDKVRTMHSTIADLNNKIAYFMAENTGLRQQLSSGGSGAGGAGMCSPQPMPMPMYAPVPYPWMPCAPPYMMKPPGSQVPLVPIPRLKQPKQPLPASKTNKKNESKTKKVASVSLVGMLFFILLFGGLVPILNVRYDNTPAVSSFVSDGFYEVNRGRVVRVGEYFNGSSNSSDVAFSNEKFELRSRVHGRGLESAVEQKEAGLHGVPGYTGNGSEPLIASLYVPRNDKLVKIDGNLIIHSVLASEKAVASQTKNRETGLAIPNTFPPALAIPNAKENGGKQSHEYRNPAERHMALSSGNADALKDHFKSTAADGKMQQWFSEGLAGPILSSGMCTEVFQFDVSAPGAIIPASSVTNVSAEHSQNVTQVNKGRNRRILQGHDVPLPRPDLNMTEQNFERNSQKKKFQGNKTTSMVVSVLIDPREAGDVDMDGVIVKKSVSRIFVVVLLDSVKYVTYSCMLPRSVSHLVAA